MERNVKRRKRRRRRSGQALRVILILVLSAAVFVVGRNIPTKKRMSVKEYFGIMSDNEIGIVVGETISNTRGLILDERIYLDYESARLIAPLVWYDEAEQLLVVTGPERKEVFSLSGGNSDEALVMLRDGVPYISLEHLKNYADIEVTEDREENRIFIADTWEYTAGTLKKDAPVRVAAGVRSRIITDAAAGETVRVTDVLPDGTGEADKVRGWTRVITPDGFAGYLEDRCLTDLRTVRAEHVRTVPEYTHRLLEEKVNLCFHQTTDQAANNVLEQSLEGVEGINVLAPTWFFLDSAKGDLTSIASENYVRTAHERGISVWPVLNDFDGAVNSAAVDSELLGSYAARSAVISRVMEELTRCGADGLNVDFEKVRSESADAYIEFLRELSVEMRTAGLTLSIDNYVPKFTKYLNRREQAVCADYLVVMCYDEHTAGASEAGSQASIAFTESGIADTIREVPAERVIVAIPFFTRIWKTTEGESPTSRAYGMRTAREQLLSYSAEIVPDEASGQNYGETVFEGEKIQAWLEDADSVEARMKLICEYGCAGSAAWKLGLETPDIWGVISGYLS